MITTFWTLTGLVVSSYFANSEPVYWIAVAWFAVPFIMDGIDRK